MKKIIKNSKKYLMLGVFVFALFFVSFSSASAYNFSLSNSLCQGYGVVNSNKTVYAPGENVIVTGNLSVNCYSPIYADNIWVTTSTTYNGTYAPLPQTYQAPNHGGPFTIFIKYGYSMYGGTLGSVVNPASGEAQFGVNVEYVQTMSVTMTASLNPVPYGRTTRVDWDTVGATSCTSTMGGISGTGPGYFTPTITADTTFEIICSGPDPAHPPNGTRSATGQVTVFLVKTDDTSPGPITNIYTKKVSKEVQDTSTTIKFLGEMNPGGDENVTAYFRYSTVAPEAVTPVFCNDIYGSSMRATNEVPVCEKNTTCGSVIRRVSIEQGGLSPNTTYYYCIVGSTTNQIDYGGVMSFTTGITSSDGQNSLIRNGISVTTNSATVVDSKSAYLNGFYNTETPAHTWFEYRKKSSQQNFAPAGTGASASIFDNFLKIFGINKAMAVATPTPNPYAWSGKIDNRARSKNTNGNMSFLLKGLSPSTVYEFRAVIKDDTSSNIKYGVISSFQTRATTGVGPSPDPGIGNPYIDPCANMDTDVNCNGTGGNGGGTGTGLTGLPDLTAGSATLSSLAVDRAGTLSSVAINTPVTLSAVIRNQGDASTIPPPVKNNTVPANTSPAVSFFKNLFGINKALAVTATTNQPNVFTKGSFYNFFQISIANPSSIPGSDNRLIGPPVKIIPTTAPNAGRVSFFNDLLNIKKALALSTAVGGMTASNTIINLPPVLMSPLGSKSSGTTTQNYTFTSLGTYYIRACADKSFPADAGLIRESYENNNCGPWAALMIGNQPGICMDPYASNYGGSLPCRTMIGPPEQICNNPSALNYGSPLPCITQSGMCLDYSASNYGGSLPCTWNWNYGTWTGTWDTENWSSGDGGFSGVWSSGDYSGTWVSTAGTGGIGTTTWTGTGNGTGTWTSATGSGTWTNGTGTGGAGTGTWSGTGTNGPTNPENLVLGQIATPPDLAIVRYHEGIETVLYRQIVGNITLAKTYGYQDGADLQNFAWNLADLLARTFGYVNSSGKEIRVSYPDIAAYQLYVDSKGILTIYEYYDSKIVNIQKMTDALRSKYYYEYYFKK